MNILIIGANSVSGQEIIKGLKNGDIYTIGTTSGTKEIPGVNKTIKEIHLIENDIDSKIQKEIEGIKIDYILYIPARGMVGIPTKFSSEEMIQESLNFSIIPMLKLSKRLNPIKTICFSGFITMNPMLLCYGCMALTKIIMEELAIEFPKKLQVIRLGMFFSKSVKGIALATYRNLKEDKYPELIEMKKEWKDSGKKFNDYFFDMNWIYEENIYKSFSNNSNIPFRRTVPEDISKSFNMILDGEKSPIINVLGDWVWMDKDMIDVPEVINSLKKYVNLEELKQYLI